MKYIPYRCGRRWNEFYFLFELNLMRRRKWSQNLLEWFLKMYTNRFEHYLWCLIQQNHLKSVFQAINGYWRHFPCTPIVHIHLHPAAHPYAGKISKDSDDFPYEEFFRTVPKCTARPLDPGANWENSRKKSNSTGRFEIEFRKQKKCTCTKSAKGTVFSGVRTIYIKTDIR